MHAQSQRLDKILTVGEPDRGRAGLPAGFYRNDAAAFVRKVERNEPRPCDSARNTSVAAARTQRHADEAETAAHGPSTVARGRLIVVVGCKSQVNRRPGDPRTATEPGGRG